MNSDLFFDGKQYISSSRAAQISGYANDYIGQLCRDNKLVCRMVGRTWYVEIDSLISHKNNNANGTRSRGVKKLNRNHFETTRPVNLPSLGTSATSLSYPMFLTSIAHKDVAFISPEIINTENAPSKSRGNLIRLTVGVCGIFLALLGFRFGLFANPTSQDVYGKVWNNINKELEASAFSSLKNLTSDVYQSISMAFRNWLFESRETILVLTGKEKVVYDNKINTSKQPVTNDPSRGMVVVPTDENTDRDGVVKKIKQSFSDDVVVTNIDSESGVITPVFKDSKGEDYLFVLVPIDQ